VPISRRCQRGAPLGFRLVSAKRVLVTGGAGFIPSNFIRHLLANTPYEVISLDALTYAGNIENLADVLSHE
jgi:dTDP-glucose 4,6-dehydratase